MAKYDTAKKKRDEAKRKRAAAQRIISTGMIKGKKAKPAQIEAARQRGEAHAFTMREQGDIMRGETGREPGERTYYTGPLPPEGTPARDWPNLSEFQQANVGLLGALGGDRDLFRQRFTPEMQAEYMRTGKIPQGFVPPRTPQPRTRTAAETATGLESGLLSGYGGYPVLSLGTPSGASYPAAAEAAEGYAGALGFNIGPEGGLVYRPWEAQAWKQSGIDPNLWNAPFANTGLLSGYVPPTTADTTPVPTATTVPTGTTTADAGPTFHETFMAPGGGHEQALQRLYAAAGGDAVWGSYPNWFNRTGGAKTTTAGDAPDFSFEDWKAGPLSRAVADQARENAFLQQSAIPVTAQGAFGPSADALAAAQAAAARTPYSYTPPTMAGSIPVPSVYTAPSWAQTGLLPPTTSGFVSDF